MATTAKMTTTESESGAVDTIGLRIAVRIVVGQIAAARSATATEDTAMATQGAATVTAVKGIDTMMTRNADSAIAAVNAIGTTMMGNVGERDATTMTRGAVMADAVAPTTALEFCWCNFSAVCTNKGSLY